MHKALDYRGRCVVITGAAGGIGRGLAQSFAAAGATLELLDRDADALARLVLEKGTDGLAAVQDEFGDRVLTSDGELDRVALARIVFSDPQARQRLNRIVHPRIRAAARRIVAAAGPDAVVVQDVPLLVETGQQDAFDLVIVVEAPLEERLRRMVEDRGMTPEDAQARIDAQATDEQRRAAADVVIVNDADLERLASVANQVWDRFLAPDAAEPSAD